MNQRIKELANQAGFNPYNYEGANAELFKKFAELIVRECLSIAHREHKKALEFDWDNDDTAQTIRDSISKHFGVEE